MGQYDGLRGEKGDGEEILTFLRSPKLFSYHRAWGKARDDFTSVLLILEWAVDVLWVEGSPGKPAVQGSGCPGNGGGVSVTLEPQRPSCGRSRKRLELTPHRARGVCFPSEFCAQTLQHQDTISVDTLS